MAFPRADDSLKTFAFEYTRATIPAICKHQGTRLQHATKVEIAPIRNTPCSFYGLVDGACTPKPDLANLENREGKEITAAPHESLGITWISLHGR